MWPQDMQLEGSWGVFKLSLNFLWALFGPPWASFGLLWGALGAPWEHFGSTLRLLRAILKVFGGSFGCVGATLGNVLVQCIGHSLANVATIVMELSSL